MSFEVRVNCNHHPTGAVLSCRSARAHVSLTCGFAGMLSSACFATHSLSTMADISSASSFLLLNTTPVAMCHSSLLPCKASTEGMNYSWSCAVILCSPNFCLSHVLQCADHVPTDRLSLCLTTTWTRAGQSSRLLMPGCKNQLYKARCCLTAVQLP